MFRESRNQAMKKQPEDKKQPRQRRHLRRIDPDRIYTNIAVYDITMVSLGRRKVLTTPALASAIVHCLNTAPGYHRWAVGQYVIMPDHLHFFCRDIGSEKDLSSFVRDVKKFKASQARRLGMPGRLWQPEFFDHVLRDMESYGEKCEYLRMNPVRAKLVAEPESWPWQGVCEEI
jgi:REP element-mobilizing transposase RayT